MIHRALFGSIERFFAVLLEHYAGAFPPWLAPVQVVGHPDHRRARRLPGRGRRAAARARASGSRSTPPTTGCRRRSATHSSRRCRTCCIAGDDDVAAGRGVVPLPRRARRRTACPSTRRSPRSSPRDRDARGAGLHGRRCRDAPRTRTPADRLWTPHRMAYIKGEGKPDHRRRGRRLPVLPRPRAARRRGPGRRPRRRSVYAVLNLYPYNAGHLMICPYRHVADYTDLDRRRDRRAGRVHQAGDDASLRAVVGRRRASTSA